MIAVIDSDSPFAVGPALAILGAHAIPGCELNDPLARTHTRIITAPSGPVPVTLRFDDDRITATIGTEDPRDAAMIITAIRRWLDLDTDLSRITRALENDIVLGPMLAARPGLRVIKYPDGFEAAIMTVLGQQVSLAAGRTFGGRLVSAFGTEGPAGLKLFPSAQLLAAATPDELQLAIGVTNARARTILAVTQACANGLSITAEHDHAEIRSRLLALPGIGPWTVDYIAVRVLGDRDAYPSGDLILRRALGVATAKEAAQAALLWSPYRAYALFHLWTHATYS